MQKIKCFFSEKENIKITLFFVFIFLILVYTTLQTTVVCDDWPYSMFLRGNERIKSVFQVLINQRSDYLYICGRMVLNGLGQFILIFPRNFYAITNSIVIVLNLFIIFKIIKLDENVYDSKKKLIYILLSFALLLSVDYVKYLMYWVMGSANYLWPMPLLLYFVYRYIKFKRFIHDFINYSIILFLSSSHESFLVFFIIFFIANMVLEFIYKQSFNKKNIIYILVLVFSIGFIFLSPGNIIRNATWYPWWNDMSWIKRLLTTVPQVALNLFKFDLLHNCVPLIFFLSVIYSIRKEKFTNCLIGATVFVYLIAAISNSGWMYLLFSILLFIMLIYSNHLNNINHWSVIIVGFYAIVYAMIITPEYAAGRPNIFMYVLMIALICMNFSQLINTVKFTSVIILFVLLLTCSREIYIYHNIGKINEERMDKLMEVQSNKTSILKWKKMPSEFSLYGIEVNAPAEENYWAWSYFCNYYQISPNTEVILYE